MKIGTGGLIGVVASTFLVSILTSLDVSGQTPPPVNKPSTIPRLPDGKPDLQGYWARTVTSMGIEAFPGDSFIRAQKSLIVDPPDGVLPYKSGGRELQKEIYTKYFDPNHFCLLVGIPRFTYQSSEGYQILQTPSNVVFLAEESHAYRIIPTDGRPHLGKKLKQWQGDARGHWEGDTFVVDTANQNGQGRLDIAGNFVSDVARVTERFTPIDADTIRYEVTIDDGDVYLKPWTLASRLVRITREYALIEDACWEGEADISHMRQEYSIRPSWDVLKKKMR